MVPEERVLDRQAHVGLGELRDHTAIDELDHRVDHALGMQHDVDTVIWRAVEPVRFHDLVALVREGRRIDRDLRTHAPGRMPERLRGRDRRERTERPIAERAAGRGDSDPPYALGRDPVEALPEPAVLAVDRTKALPRPAARGTDEVAADDEDLFVGERDVLARLEGGERRPQTGDARSGDEHEIHVVRGRELRQIVVPGRDARDAEARRDLLERLTAGARRERRHAQLVRVRCDDFEGLLADRARCTEDRDARWLAHLTIIPDPRRRSGPRPAARRPAANRRDRACRRDRGTTCPNPSRPLGV